MIGAWKGPESFLEHIKVALRSACHLFEIFMHHGSNLSTFHLWLIASAVVAPGVCGTKNFSSVRLYSAPQLH